MVVLGGVAVSYERGTPVGARLDLLGAKTGPPRLKKIGILLRNNQRQHRTLHIQKDVLPYALC